MAKFEREIKYLVVKRADLELYLNRREQDEVEELIIHCDAERLRAGKKSLQGVFIRDTSPFYDEAWSLVEREVTGVVPDVSRGALTLALKQHSRLHKECAHLTELNRQARVALHKIATHEELVNEADAYWGLRNEAEEALASMKDYDVAVMATQAVRTGNLCAPGRKLYDCCPEHCSECGHKGEAG